MTLLPLIDLSRPGSHAELDRYLAQLRATTFGSPEAAQTVAKIIHEVAAEGDAALVRYMRQWTDPDFSASRIRVSQQELDDAERSLDPALKHALVTAIEHVREYQTHILPQAHQPIHIDGAELGLRFTPMQRVGLAVPGGRAAYPSSVVMLAVPALAAGVPSDGLCVVSPPPTRRAGEPVFDISPLVLAACKLTGVKHVYRIGGAQAMAALALGTQTVSPVDFIAGPGNVYTQLAKQQLLGKVGIDGFYGPSEIVTLIDDTARPDRVASDLIAQAEHDPGRCFVIGWSAQVLENVRSAVTAQLASRKRASAIEQSLRDSSAALLVENEDQAVELSDRFAAEHVNLAVAEPARLLGRLKHGGEFFLGDNTPVAAGDYFAGPSHCLPTGTTARYSSGISVYTFLKRSGTVAYTKGMNKATTDAIALLAEAEGLDGHAHSVRLRSS